MNLIYSIASVACASRFKATTFTCESCHRALVLLRGSSQKAGIRMHGYWYCSSACITFALEKKISESLKTRLDQASHVTRMPLGLILIRQGLLTSAQLKESTDEQKEAGREIGEVLVRQGSVTEKQVTAARAEQWGCPVFSVPNYAIPSGIQIPSALIRLYSAIPVHHVVATRRLLVGFVHGIEYKLLYAIEQMTGCKTLPCFVTPSDFQSQKQHVDHAQKQRQETTLSEMTFQCVESPVEMARILCSYCVDREADEVAIAQCKEYLWARLKCGPKTVDLMFKSG